MSKNCELSIKDFKNQVGRMVEALSTFDSSDRSEAFEYLQSCVKGLEPNTKEVIEIDLSNNLSNHDSQDEENIDGDFNTGSNKENNENLSHEMEKEVEVNNCSDNSSFICIICGHKCFKLPELYSHFIEDHPGDLVDCKTCNLEFISSEVYEMHIKLDKCDVSTSKRPDILKCPFCDKIYQNFQHYSLHVEGHKRNKCPECGVHLSSKKMLEKHFLLEHNKELKKDIFACHYCDKKFAQKRSLFKHCIMIHSKKMCSICGKLFESDSELNVHELLHVDKTFLCNICGDTFLRHQQYQIHLKAHDKYQCLTCEISYPNKSKFERHEREGHELKGLSKDHQCNICGDLFHFQSNLYFHKKSHSSSKNYGCQSCNKNFKSYQTYKEHLSTEQHLICVDSEVLFNQFPCSKCNKDFPTKRMLSKHNNQCHQKTKKVFLCEICDFKTENESCLNRHKRLHTTKKEIICEKCGDSFYTKNALNCHINYTHSEERNFSCEKCGLTFKSSSVLVRHMLTHSVERTYKCHCGMSYKFKGNLNRHQTNAHGETSKSNRVKRLVKDEIASLTSKTRKSKKNEQHNDKEQTNPDSIYPLIDSQSEVTLPYEQIDSSGIMLSSSNSSENQMIRNEFNNLNFTVDNRTPMVFPQNLDIVAFREVDNLLQSGVHMKAADNNEIVNSVTQNIFSRHLADGSAFLDNANLIHPSLEATLVSSLEDSSLSSVHHLDNMPHGSNNNQQHINSLNEVSYYNIHYI